MLKSCDAHAISRREMEERGIGRVIVLDTSALIMDYDPLSIDEEHYTVPQVLDELAPGSTPRLRLMVATEAGRVRLRSPSPGFVRRVEEASARAGDAPHLSGVDRLVLALSLQLREEGLDPLVLSDDYAIQNMADHLGLDYRPLSTFGIRYRFRWIRYCPACFRRYPQDWPSGVCGVCGTALKRRVLRKTLAKRGDRSEDDVATKLFFRE